MYFFTETVESLFLCRDQHHSVTIPLLLQSHNATIKKRTESMPKWYQSKHHLVLDSNHY